MSHCTRPPAGWYCNLDEGHDGPCPAHPVTDDFWKRLTWATVAYRAVFWIALCALVYIVRTT